MKLYDSPSDPLDVRTPDVAAVPPRSKPATSRAVLISVAGIAALGLGALGLALASGEAPGAAPAVAVAPAMTVTLAAVARADWDSSLSASGAIEPWQETVIGAQNSGLRLLEVRAEVGDRVQRGQVLARFDAATLRASLAELQATLLRSEAEARQAATNRDRMHLLADSGGVSRQELLQYATLADTSAAQVAVVRAQLESRRLQLGHAEVRAPDDGVISARSATVGAVGDNGQELFRLILKGRLEWRGELTAAQLTNVKSGQRVKLNLPDGSTADAQVRRIAPRLDAQSRLGLVYADVDARSAARAGMYAAGRVVLRQQTALIVPAASVVIRDGRSYVFKVQGINTSATTVAAQAVQVGRRHGDAVEILATAAMQAGERVVVQGAGFLKDGDSVRVVAAPAATSAKGA